MAMKLITLAFAAAALLDPGAADGSPTGRSWHAIASGPPVAVVVDTLIEVERGTRLVVKNHHGSITVRTWDRSAVRLDPSPAAVRSIQVSGDGKLLRVLAGPGPGAPSSVDLVLTVPAEMSLDLAGPFAAVTVEGSRGQVTVETVQGDVLVRGGSGSVSVRSVDGDVRLAGALGNVQVHAVDGDVYVEDAEGGVSVDAIDGDVVLRGIRSGNVRVSTVDGDVSYEGQIQNGGRYRLVTHDGTISVAVPEGSNVTVAVRTYAGDFRASFPLTVRPAANKRFEFALGDGTARLELEAFDGEIRLVRPGELPTARGR